MSQFQAHFSPNLLIQAMTREDLALLHPCLERIALVQNQVLAEANQPIEHLYFPEGCIVLLTTPVGHDMAKVGIVGREGLIGTPILLGTDRSPSRAFVQVASPSALRIATADMRRLLRQSETLQALMLRYVEAYLVQSAHSTVSNAHFRIEARLARFLLMCHDRVDGDEIHITHECMAMIIAAQRTGVTLCLHVFEGDGAIKSTRGSVVIRNRAALEELAGDAYGSAEAEYRRLIGPFGHQPSAAEPCRQRRPLR